MSGDGTPPEKKETFRWIAWMIVFGSAFWGARWASSVENPITGFLIIAGAALTAGLVVNFLRRYM